MSEITSPLMTQVIKRNINPFEDDFEEEEVDTSNSTKEEEAKKPKEPEPKEFNPEIDDEVEYSIDKDFEHAQPNEISEAQEKNRKIVAKNILDLVAFGIPKGVTFLTALPENELKTAVIEAERKDKPAYKEIFQQALDKNKKDSEQIEEWVRYFTVQMEEPLREVMKGKGFDITPEQQLMFWGAGLVGTVGYLTYDISQSNKALMKEITQLRKDMDSIEIKEVKKEEPKKEE